MQKYRDSPLTISRILASSRSRVITMLWTKEKVGEMHQEVICSEGNTCLESDWGEIRKKEMIRKLYMLNQEYKFKQNPRTIQSKSGI